MHGITNGNQNHFANIIITKQSKYTTMPVLQCQKFT